MNIQISINTEHANIKTGHQPEGTTNRMYFILILYSACFHENR